MQTRGDYALKVSVETFKLDDEKSKTFRYDLYKAGNLNKSLFHHYHSELVKRFLAERGVAWQFENMWLGENDSFQVVAK